MSTVEKTYSGSCHCGAVRFRFKSAEITSGCRCNCSICIRKGFVMSSEYVTADAFEPANEDSLAVYQFGDRDVYHYFCKTCGICPFIGVASVPPTYQGRAKIGDRRVNLGCVDGVDPLALQVDLIDGRSF
jgi:hypothetical protein